MGIENENRSVTLFLEKCFPFSLYLFTEEWFVFTMFLKLNQIFHRETPRPIKKKMVSNPIYIMDISLSELSTIMAGKVEMFCAGKNIMTPLECIQIFQAPMKT